MYFLHFKVPGLTDYCVSRALRSVPPRVPYQKKNVKDIHAFMYHFTL